jgi:hypothetical protein
MSYVVIDHHHDEAAGVYRLVIGQPIYDDVPIFEDGQQVLEERSDGAVVPRTEQVVVGHEDVRDYVFADDDERWHDAGGDRLDDEEVAAAQPRPRRTPRSVCACCPAPARRCKRRPCSSPR